MKNVVNKKNHKFKFVHIGCETVLIIVFILGTSFY